MPEDASSSGTISESCLAQFAEYWEAWENAIDPTSKKAREARWRYEREERLVYDTQVVPNFPSLSFHQFKSYLRIQCRKRVEANEGGKAKITDAFRRGKSE